MLVSNLADFFILGAAMGTRLKPQQVTGISPVLVAFIITCRAGKNNIFKPPIDRDGTEERIISHCRVSI